MKKACSLIAFVCICLLASNKIAAQTFMELNDQFIELYKKGSYKEAIVIGAKAVAQAKKEYGNENINYAVATHNLAECYYALKDWKPALPLYHQAIKVYTIANKTSETSDVALCTNSIGSIYLVLKKYDSSAIFFEKSFTYFMAHASQEYNNAIGVMNNLTELYIPLKKYAEAIKIYNKILPIVETQEGITSDNYTAINTNLIFSLTALGEYKKALTSLAIKRKSLIKTKGNQSAELALCDNEIGNDYLLLKQYDSSAIYFEQSFAYFTAHVTEQYENAIVLMNNLHTLYLSTTNFAAAKATYNKILPFIEVKEGIVSENYLNTFLHLINAMNGLEEFTSMEISIKRILPDIEKASAKFPNEYAQLIYKYGWSLKNLHRNDEALQYLKKSVKAFTAAAAKENSGLIAYSNNDIGLVYMDMKQYDSSAVYFEKAYGFYTANWSENYQNFIVVGNNLSIVYFKTNKSKELKIVCENSLPIIEKKETVHTENYCIRAMNMLDALIGLKDFVNGEKWARKLAAIREKKDGKRSTGYTDALDKLAFCLSYQNDFKQAEAVLLQCMQIKGTFKTADTISLVGGYNSLGDLYIRMGEYEKGYKCFYQSIYLLEKAYLTETENYRITLRSLAYSYIDGTRTADAKAILIKLIAIETKREGDSFSGNAELLVSLANCEYQLNEFSSAQEHVEKGMAIAIKNFGEITDIVAIGKEILGFIYHKSGNSNKAVLLFNESLSINQKVFGKESSNVAITLSNMGILYQELGSYADAEVVLKKSLEIREKIFGKDHPEYAMSLLNLGMVYADQAGYENAINMLSTAMDIYIKRELAGSNNFIIILSNLTLIISSMGNHDEAKGLYLKILDLLDAQHDSTSATRYILLNNLSTACTYANNYAEGLKYGLAALDFAKRINGTKSIEYIKSANNCLIAYKGIGEFGKANTLLTEVIATCKEILGDDAAILSTIYSNAYLLENSQHNFIKASIYLNKCIDISLNNFRNNFYTLSEKEKLAWWQEQNFNFYFSPSLLMQFTEHTPEMTNTLVNQQLQLKGFVLNDASASLRKARASGNKALNKLIDQWQSSRSILSKQLALPVTQRFYKTDSLEKIANTFEKNINQEAAGIINVNKDNAVTWQTIQSSLKEGEAAVEFMRFPFFRNNKFTDTVQYAAIIIRKDQVPKFVTVGTEQQINWCLTGGKVDSKQTRINSLYRSSIKGGNSDETFAGDSLYSIVWKPLMPYLQNISTVSYSPDGLLHKVAFHALPVAKEKLLIDVYRLQEYTSIRQIAEQSNETTKWNAAYLMGNADFNTLSNTSSAEGVNVNFSTKHASDAWVSLPGTEKEINALQPLFSSKGIKVTTLNGILATEEKFKQLNNHSPSIIHLATHGFFLPDPKKKTTMGTGTENSYALSNDPLMRSGIIMAGANKAWAGEKIPLTLEDGIVTAYEIAQLNLSSTKLVVLSACETALGDLQGTEGVFGLQRAFKIAGVKNLIVSLWQVPDKETAEMMGIFYGNMLNGVSVREAFYKTQKEMRSKYAPYSWAAFVLVE